MRPQNIFGKLRQLSSLPLSCWTPFITGWNRRHKTGYVPCGFPGSRRLIQVPLRAFYQSFEFCCESRQGLQEMKFFLKKLRFILEFYDHMS